MFEVTSKAYKLVGEKYPNIGLRHHGSFSTVVLIYVSMLPCIKEPHVTRVEGREDYGVRKQPLLSTCGDIT